MKINNPLEGTS